MLVTPGSERVKYYTAKSGNISSDTQITLLAFKKKKKTTTTTKTRN